MTAPVGPIKFCAGLFGGLTELNHTQEGTSFGVYEINARNKTVPTPSNTRPITSFHALCFCDCAMSAPSVVPSCGLSIQNDAISGRGRIRSPKSVVTPMDSRLSFPMPPGLLILLRSCIFSTDYGCRMPHFSAPVHGTNLGWSQSCRPILVANSRARTRLANLGNLVDREDVQSMVSEAEFQGVSLHEIWMHTAKRYSVTGTTYPRFPILVKILDASDVFPFRFTRRLIGS